MTKYCIAVAVVGEDHVIGPALASMVVVDTNYFRRYGPAMKLPLEKAITFLKKGLQHLYFVKIKPDENDTEQEFSDGVDKAVIECLNTYKQFWKHDITIVHDYHDRMKQKVVSILPENLKQKEKIDISNWGWNTDNKVAELVAMFARDLFQRSHKEISDVYGDFGTGGVDDKKTQEFIKLNPDCPHIRRHIKWK